jgi:hypothetical protein
MVQPHASVRVDHLPKFGPSHGEHETQVVQVGVEYAAIFVRTGEVIGHCTYKEMLEAADVAQRAAHKGYAA